MTADRKLDLHSEARRAVRRVDPTARCRLVLLAVGGPYPPFLRSLGGGLVSMLVTNAYFVTLTDQAVYIHRGSRPQDLPETLYEVVPLDRAAGLIAKVKRGNGWNALFLRLPGRRRPLRLNVSFQSRDELESFVARIRKSTAQAAPAAQAVAAP
ncbi:hypothetical protein GCM10009738_28530 [Kitasatospora viridis]